MALVPGAQEEAVGAGLVSDAAVVHGTATTVVATAGPAKSALSGAYERPNNATTQEQRDSVQGQPCATCGATGQKNAADHKEPLVKEFYKTGTIDKDKMRSLDAVQPQCQSCSNQQGGYLSSLSKALKKLFFGSGSATP